MLMIFLIPNAVVHLIFGDKWMGMVPYLNILSFWHFKLRNCFNSKFFVGVWRPQKIKQNNINRKAIICDNDIMWVFYKWINWVNIWDFSCFNFSSTNKAISYF